MTYLSSFLLLQSFAKIAHASPEQLRRLPGFGQVKVRRIVDAFEKPFRNKATSAPLVTSTAGSEEANLESHDGGGADGVLNERFGHNTTQNTNNKSSDLALKEKNLLEASNEMSSSNTATTLPMATSNIHDFGSVSDIGLPTNSSHETDPDRMREFSPPWDIELDLN